MTCKVVFMWELGWNTPIKEADLWMTVDNEFEIDQVYAVPISGIHSGIIKERKELSDVIKENPDHTIVWCHEKGAAKLKDFTHPENALYIFGKTNYSPFLNMAKDNEISLQIETPAENGMMWSHQAGGIILYDRFMKWQ